MKRIHIYPVILACLAIASCNEDWLEPEPLSFFAPENLMVDKEGYEALLITLRKNHRNPFYGQFNTVVSEAVFTELGAAGPVNNLAIRNMDLQLTPSNDGNYYVLDNCQWNYRPIRVANAVISRIDDIEWEQEADRNWILAEAYFHRAYWYYLLVNQFGDMPFIGRELTEPKLDFNTHSRWAILDRIQQEVEFAVEWLPDDYTPGVPTKGAGYHLLTKIYLANNEFEKAVESASAVINGGYQLMNTRFGADAGRADKNIFWDLHRPENVHDPANTETILGTLDRFDLPDDVRTGGLASMRNYHPAWWTQGRVPDSQGSSGTVDEGPMYDTLGRGNAHLRPSPYYAYELWSDPDDLRRRDGNWIFQEELLYNNPASADYGKPIDPGNFSAPVDTFQHYYSFPFYKTFVPEQNPDRVPNGGNGDWYVFRLAETYLLRAEAYFWLGSQGEAAADINEIRKRAGAAEIPAGDVSIDFILDERARELFAEEPRKTELTRIAFIMAAGNLNGYSLDNFSEHNFWYDRVMAKNQFYREHLRWGENECRISPHHVLWPVPANVINTNTLGRINQNEGYPGAENNQPPLTEITEND